MAWRMGSAPRRLLAVFVLFWTGTVLLRGGKLVGQEAQLEDKEVRYKGKPAAFWIGQLKSKEVELRREAVQAIVVLGPDARAAAPTLLQTLDDKDTAVRIGAMEALGSIGPAAKAAIPILLRSLQDKDVAFKMRALDSLSRIAPEEKAVASAVAARHDEPPHPDPLPLSTGGEGTKNGRRLVTPWARLWPPLPRLQHP